MREVYLNGEEMTTMERVHEVIRREMGFADYYGNNLDALWDLLSVESERTEIVLENAAVMCETLGDYAEAVIQVFRDAEASNECLTFRIGKQ